MRKETIEHGQQVKISENADFKYNNRRSGAKGEVVDLYTSDMSGDLIAEVEMKDDRGGYDLIRVEDLEPV